MMKKRKKLLTFLLTLCGPLSDSCYLLHCILGKNHCFAAVGCYYDGRFHFEEGDKWQENPRTGEILPHPPPCPEWRITNLSLVLPLHFVISPHICRNIRAEACTPRAGDML